MDEQERYAAGMQVRRAVLGDAHVDRTLKNKTPFNEEFQDFITRYAWGEIWTRPGLPRHTRSLITLAMLVALNRGAEFRMHVRAAFNNGVTREEIKELLMQTGIYCGLPAANEAFHLAEAVFAELDSEGPANQGPLGSERHPGDEASPSTPQTGEAICPECSGSGSREGKPCENCEGTGRVIVLVGDA